MKRFNDSKIALLLLAFVLTLMLTAASAKADFIFGKAHMLGISGGVPWVTADHLELYFVSDRAGGLGYFDIWVTSRSSVWDPWGPPVNFGAPVNSQYNEAWPSLSPDGLTLYLSDCFSGVNAAVDRPGGMGGHDIWMSTRAGGDAPWGTPVNPGPPINTSSHEVSPSISRDGLTLVFASNRAGGYGDYDLWMCTRPTLQDPWDLPVNLGPAVNTGSADECGTLSADGLVLFFESNRAGGLGGYDIYMTRRESLSDPWEPPVNGGPAVNARGDSTPGAISADGRTLYFFTSGAGGFDLYSVPILPVVDFNGDEKVDLKDFSRLARYWGQNESSVDMGPMPWGDGTVDIQDVAVLAGYWVKEFGLLAHWTLDETEGGVAQDSAGGKDATANGNPVWQPTAGKVRGALQLDGVDDYVSTPFVLDPAAGAFSIFAWVKGGGPEQGIISQAGGVNWLSASATEGKLMTELMAAGRFGRALISGVVIPDGDWHRLGLTWDGSSRVLYVDDVQVAKDTQLGLAGSQGGLYIGAGKNLEAGSFWSGLIDDVRIYDRAVSP
jgi:hypothetical protein